MSRLLCENCRDWIEGREVVVDVDGEAQPWCTSCATDKGERDAEVDAERGRGVYKGDGMSERTEIEYFHGGDGWYWRQLGGNGEEEDRSSEGYSTKEHAEEARARVEEQDRRTIDEPGAVGAVDAGDAVDGQQQTPPYDPGQSTPVDDVDAAKVSDQVGEVDAAGEPKPDYPHQAA